MRPAVDAAIAELERRLAESAEAAAFDATVGPAWVSSNRAQKARPPMVSDGRGALIHRVRIASVVVGVDCDLRRPY